MLAVQKYLETHSLEELSAEFGIKVVPHPEFPQLNILNYDQIDSPKMHPIVRDCRGLIIDTTDNSIACSCMTRFFNLGEALEITDKFDWSGKVNCLSKEDGSLLSLWFNKYSQKWEVKTRGSFANQQICENGPRWDELFFSLLPEEFIKLEAKQYSFIFEMCSMYNQVVRQYKEPTLFLLTVIHNETSEELSVTIVDEIASFHNIKRPTQFYFKCLNDILGFYNWYSSLSERDKLEIDQPFSEFLPL